MRLASPGARVAALLAAPLFASTCRIGDALQPAATKDISLTYAGDTVLVVAAPVTPAVTVAVDGAPLADARLRFTSSDTAVVAVHGDTLLPRARGAATLTIALVSSALPSAPPSVTLALVVVADTVTLDSSAVHFASLGDTVTLVATARDARGAAIAGAGIAFASSDTGVVAVSAGGRVTARANGAATLRAVLDRDTAVAEVTVQQALTRWTFEPASVHLDALTAADTVVATGHDARGSAIAALAPGAWTVGDAAVVTLAGPGRVTAKRNGATFLYATLGAVRDSVSVTVAQRAVQVSVTPDPVPAVTSLGDAVQLTGRAFDRQAVELQGAQLSWFTLDPGVVRVTGDGLVTTLATGSARVVAALDAGADTATVTISNDPATITVLPDSAHATSVGDTLVFRAVARNARGDSVAATVAWQTPDTAIVVLLSEGRVRARAVGTARVIAVVGGRSDTSLARVTNEPTAIDIGPASRIYTSLGDVDTLPVTILNARDSALARGSVTWTSEDPTVARVSTAGVVTAKDTGQTVIRAASGSVYDSVLVTVQNLPASIVVASLASDTLTAVGQALVLAADVRNARGAQIVGFPVAWRSTNRAAVDTVLPNGTALAIGWGSTILVGQAGTAADTVRLAVVNPTRLVVSNALFTGLRVGTVARPYAKIQDAVNAADAGDTVLVLRGAGGYSESVVLARRVVVLGDSSAWLGGGRNPSLLPLLAHDTGAAAITANTSAPVAVRYLAIRHTLDGPAFTSDGSDVDLQWVYVNPPGSVTSRIGRGISVRNSSSGTVLRHVRLNMVRGYGISLVNTSSAEVSADSIVGVDSIGVPEGGAGISIRGGVSNTVSANVIRATRGPRILVRGAASLGVYNHTLSGRHPLIQLDSASGDVKIKYNTFQVARDYTDAADDPDCPTDNRCAGVLITDSRNGTFTGGTPPLAFTSPAEISQNTFYDAFSNGSVGEGIGIRLRRSMAYGSDNVYRYIQFGDQLEGNSKAVFQNERADTVGTLGVSFDADTLAYQNPTTHEAQAVSHYNDTPAGQAYLFMMNGQISNRRGGLVFVWDTAATGNFQNVTFESAPNNQSIFFRGRNLTLYADAILGTGDTISGYLPGGPYNAAVTVFGAASTWMYGTWIRGFSTLPGLKLFGGVSSFTVSQNVLTRNRVGLFVDASVPSSAIIWSPGNDAVFDNLLGGLQDNRPSGAGLDGWWWGDGRGPLGTTPAATGDSVLAAPAAPVFLTAPPQTGTTPAGLRIVRGSGQSWGAGTPLPKALTLRVVDAAGLPVPGVAVQFTVTGGGGDFAGQSYVRVAANGDGLAEATLTLGATPGPNTVEASATGVAPVTFTATGR